MEKDPALVWEAETLAKHRRVAATQDRAVPDRRTQDGSEAASRPRPTEPASWVTLRQAHEATGIPVSTVRTWARKGKITGQLTEGRWMVSLSDVRDRGERLGRISGAGVDAATRGTNRRSPDTAPRVEPPPDTMIVPLAAWERMLNQLGNLHEAGQQLAVARERAAKAETEASFLRQQLEAIRRDATAASAVAPVPAEAEPATEPAAVSTAVDGAAPDDAGVDESAARIGTSPGVLPQPPTGDGPVPVVRRGRRVDTSRWRRTVIRAFRRR